MTESIPERTMDRSAKDGELVALLARVEAARGAVWRRWTCRCGWVDNRGAACGYCSRDRPLPPTVDLSRADAREVAALLKALIAEAASPTGGQLGPGTNPK